jgi:hypothetical protein
LILVDANLLLYAVDESSPVNEKARKWWESALSGKDPVYLCWTVISAFIRIGTNPRVFENPLMLNEAVSIVEGWFTQPCVRIAVPTENHWNELRTMLNKGKANGNLVTDAHLAALAREYNCTLYSSDADFARFKGIKWKNPLE